jgi:hypothetical protein
MPGGGAGPFAGFSAVKFATYLFEGRAVKPNGLYEVMWMTTFALGAGYMWKRYHWFQFLSFLFLSLFYF